MYTINKQVLYFNQQIFKLSNLYLLLITNGFVQFFPFYGNDYIFVVQYNIF